MSPAKLITRFRVDGPRRLRLADVALQKRLYAEDGWAILVIVQGVDAAGKASAVWHVLTGLNLQRCSVTERRRA